MIRTKLTSPDIDTFRKVSKLLSRNGCSVAATSNTNLTHVVTSKISPKLTESLAELGAETELV